MPICKNCNSRIDRFNKDRCPICGVVNPFEGMTSETIEITTSVDETTKLYKPCKKLTMLLLFIFLGFFGVPFFYIKQPKIGVYYLLINLIGIGAVGFILGFYSGIGMILGYVIAVIIFLVINSIVGVIMYKKNNLQDGRGEFII